MTGTRCGRFDTKFSFTLVKDLEMTTSRLLVAIALIVVGLVWIFQGIGWLGGSFMTGSMRWFYIGIAMAVAGAGLLIWRR